MSAAARRSGILFFAAAVLAHAGTSLGAAGAGGAPPAPAAYAVRQVASLPPYRPQGEVRGTIRLWGHGSPKHDFMGRLVRRWSRLFQRYQPDVRIVNRMYGTASAIGALYTGAGNLAILGEEISPAAEKAFERERGYRPTRIEIATGSLETNYFDYAHMIFVNRANPITRLTVGQLAGIFGEAPAPGVPLIRTWGELGLRGPWAGRTIQPYSWKVDEDFGLFFRTRVLGGSHRWNPMVRQFVTFTRPDGSVNDRGRQILQALARDRDGIAISNVRFSNPEVKALRLAWTSSGPYVSATPRTLISQGYPLTRIIPAFVDRASGTPLDPAVREFLRFILSRQGQQALIEESGYLPLGRRQIRAQLALLERLSRPSVRRRASRRMRDGARLGRTRVQASIHGPAVRPGLPDRALAAPSRLALRAAHERVLRVWGYPRLAGLAWRWVRAFRKVQPRVRVELHMSGSDTAMAGLYTGRADLALLGRAATDSEVKAFEWVFRCAPAHVPILLGSRDTSGESPVLAVLVRHDNPLRRIDFAQLQGLLEPRPPAGVPRLRTWGQLGLTGRWATHRVDLYIADTDSGTGRFFRDTVLGGSALLDWSRLAELGAERGSGGQRGHARILRALIRDPYGLAITRLPRGRWPVSVLAVGRAPAGPYYRPTAAVLRENRYPLERLVYAYLEPEPGREARQFLRYILDPGARAQIPPGSYLPLPASAPGKGPGRSSIAPGSSLETACRNPGEGSLKNSRSDTAPPFEASRRPRSPSPR